MWAPANSVVATLVVAAVGCTSASVGENGNLSLEDGAGVDGGFQGNPGSADASPGRTAVTLSQTTSDAITPLNSVGCIERDDDGEPIEHHDNSYYRAFDLAAEGVDRDLEIDYVVLGIEKASSPTGSQPATLALHTLTGDDLELANLTLLESSDIQIANQDGTLYNVPIAATVPAGSTLVVELFVEASGGRDRLFFIGSNGAGQSAPSYLRAPKVGCDIPRPTDFVALGFPSMHMILKVVGEY